jgi:hypothetical protein
MTSCSWCKAAVLTLLLLTLSSVCPADNDALLPRDTNVVPPSSEIPADVAAFSGRWEDQWNSGPPHVLIVRKISPAKIPGKYDVDAVYAWGSTAYSRPGFREVDATIEAQELIVELGRGVTVARYKLAADKTRIEGTWQSRGAQYLGTFMRAAPQ